MVAFCKYHGAGNDFILIDNRQSIFPVGNRPLIERLCDRRLGIGADGVLLLENSQVADYKMRIFNADGSEPAMCGNGIRCLIDFIGTWDASPTFEIQVKDRIFHCRKIINELIGVNLGTPSIQHWPIELALQEGSRLAFVLDTGVPHAVFFVDDILAVPCMDWGKEVRCHQAFAPDGVNVNFVQMECDGSIAMRTFERGVEAETLSCGTGAAAAAWTTKHLRESSMNEPLIVKTRNSMQDLSFQKSLLFAFPPSKSKDQEIEMIGPAHCVFSGQIDFQTLS